MFYYGHNKKETYLSSQWERKRTRRTKRTIRKHKITVYLEQEIACDGFIGCEAQLAYIALKIIESESETEIVSSVDLLKALYGEHKYTKNLVIPLENGLKQLDYVMSHKYNERIIICPTDKPEGGNKAQRYYKVSFKTIRDITAQIRNKRYIAVLVPTIRQLMNVKDLQCDKTIKNNGRLLLHYLSIISNFKTTKYSKEDYDPDYTATFPTRTVCRVSKEVLARGSDLSVKTIQKYNEVLRDNGFICIIKPEYFIMRSENDLLFVPQTYCLPQNIRIGLEFYKTQKYEDMLQFGDDKLVYFKKDFYGTPMNGRKPIIYREMSKYSIQKESSQLNNTCYIDDNDGNSLVTGQG